jgi:hypothetical protein
MSRKNKMFLCMRCLGRFERTWTEEEAVAELAKNFPGEDVAECVLVCDDCYKRMGFGHG